MSVRVCDAAATDIDVKARVGDEDIMRLVLTDTGNQERMVIHGSRKEVAALLALMQQTVGALVR